jgi:hypothetical protein
MGRMTLIRLALCLGVLGFSVVGTAPTRATVSCPTTECSTVIPNCNACGLFLPLQQQPCVDGSGNTRTQVLFICCTYPTGPRGLCTR